MRNFIDVHAMSVRHAQQAMDAQRRRKAWNGKGKFGLIKNGKYTDVSNYSFDQYKQMYTEMFSRQKVAKKSSSISLRKVLGSRYNNRIEQASRRGRLADQTMNHLSANQPPSLANMNKNQLMKLLSQALQRQSKGGH